MLTTSNFIDACLKLTGCVFAVCCLFACHPSEQLRDAVQDYQQRMANVLQHDPATFVIDYLPEYPSSAWEQEQAQTLMKLTDFYQLQHCQLASLVAERNTVLGKIQLPSTRFIYEKQLLEGLQGCIEQTQSSPLNAKLHTWLSLKQQNITLVWAEMMQKSSEIRHALSSNQGFISGQIHDGLSETVAALHFLINSEHQALVESPELEQHLASLAKFALPAKLWRSQNLLTHNMQTSTLWLQQLHVTRLCDGNTGTRASKQMEYLVNVFQLFFVEKIQPIASQINHYHYKLSPLFEALMQHPALSEEFKAYLYKQDQLNFADYQTAMQQHIALWQQVFKACQLSPGNTKRPA